MSEQDSVTGAANVYVSRPTPVTVLCPECGELIEVRDVQALILTLHLRHECAIRFLLGTHDHEGAA